MDVIEKIAEAIYDVTPEMQRDYGSDDEDIYPIPFERLLPENKTNFIAQALAAIAALVDGDLSEAGSKAALASTPTVSEDDTYIIIRAYLQALTSLKETPNG